MKIFLISSFANINFAKTLFSGTKIQINYSFGSNPLSTDTKRSMSFSDAIVAIIDQDTSDSPFLMAEISHAISVTSSSNMLKSPVFIPILINNAPLPNELDNFLYISCNPQSISQIKQTKSEVLHLLRYKPTPLLFSSAYKLKPMGRLVLAIIGLIMGIIGLSSLGDAWSILINGLSTETTFSEFLCIAPEMLTAVAHASIAIFFMYWISVQLIYSNNDDVESYSDRLKETIVHESYYSHPSDSAQEKSNPEIDALGRMLINLEDIKEYYTWSQKQAKSSFYFAVAICIFGFILLSSAVFILLSSDSNWGASIISAVGGVVSELIAGTALIVYKNSLLQLNHYHQALHEDERFLSSVNLLNRFSTTEIQDEMLKELIRSEIQMNLNATTEAAVSSHTEKEK